MATMPQTQNFLVYGHGQIESDFAVARIAPVTGNVRFAFRYLRAPQFTPDGNAVVYPVAGEKNEYNLWLHPLESKPGRQITHFSSEQIYGFGWSPDGKKLLVARGHTESDVILLRDTSK